MLTIRSNSGGKIVRESNRLFQDLSALLLGAINRLHLAGTSDSIPGCERKMRGRFQEQHKRACAGVP
jgi:hypothetical protein